MLSETLAKARAHIAGGWAPTLSRDAVGEACGDEDEGITDVCILDACLLAARRDLLLAHRAMRSLGVLVAPVGLGDWEAAPERTQTDVLALFARTAKHALTKETR